MGEQNGLENLGEFLARDHAREDAIQIDRSLGALREILGLPKAAAVLAVLDRAIGAIGDLGKVADEVTHTREAGRLLQYENNHLRDALRAARAKLEAKGAD